MLYIFTLSWEGKDKLTNLYPTLLPSLGEINYKWLIKDNGSKDGTIDLINSWKNENIIGYSYPDNLQNYSQGNNWLFDQAKPKQEDLVLLLNNDITFGDTNSINNMISIIQNNQMVGIVGAKLNYLDRKDIIQHNGVLFHQNNIGTPFNYRSGRKEEDRDNQNYIFPMTTGALLLTRASLYKEMGGLDEKFLWCFDDCDYCLNVGLLGKKVVVCGNTKAYHEESATLKKNPVQKLFLAHNIKIFYDKWKQKIDKNLAQKYDKDPTFAIYKN